MIHLDNKYMCMGCGACKDVCPVSCIRMEEDAESFLYPMINANECINCSLCERVCPALNDNKFEIKEAYAGVYAQNHMASASGGAFWALAQSLLDQGFFIAGVKWDQGFKCIHSVSSDPVECELFRGSKYIQSDTTGLFKSIKHLLVSGQKVCVSGTPCQISAVKNYIGEHNNLLLVDLICHGITSQCIFDSEIDYLERKYKNRIVKYQFKCKDLKNGTVNTRRSKVLFKNGDWKVFDKWEDPFLRGYYSRLFYRPSCEHCPYATPSRVGDITLGDAWDIESLYPELNSNKGVSLILVNTAKGEAYTKEISSKMTLYQLDVEWALEHNECLREPTRFHPLRNSFFKMMSQSFEKAVFNLTQRRIQDRFKDFLRRCYHFFCKKRII